MARAVHVLNIKRRPAAPTGRHRAQHYIDRAKHLDVDISDRELAMLRKLVEWEGPAEIAGSVGVSQLTLMKVCGGFLAHCRPETRRKFRTFFGERAGS